MALEPELKLDWPVTVNMPVWAMAPPVVVMLRPPAPMVRAGRELIVALLVVSALSVAAPPREIAPVPALKVSPKLAPVTVLPRVMLEFAVCNVEVAATVSASP